MNKLLILLAVLLASCAGKSQETKTKGDFKVEFLFENDGCKVFRFEDGIRTIYYTTC